MAYRPPPRHLVMFGDSLTQFGLWEHWFAGHPILNRGISGETSEDLLVRIDGAINDPIAVFLLIGTNDLAWGYSPQHIGSNVWAILREIEQRAPGTPVVVQSVMPRTRAFRDAILAVNEQYRALVDAAGPHVEYLDLWPALADQNGDLRGAYTPDGVHLSDAGYAAWVEVLRPHIGRMLRGAGAYPGSAG